MEYSGNSAESSLTSTDEQSVKRLEEGKYLGEGDWDQMKRALSVGVRSANCSLEI